MFLVEHEMVNNRLEEFGEYPFEQAVWEVKGAEEREEVQNKDVKYKGQWLNEEYNGRGQLRFAEGSIYHGYFKDGKMHGHGRMIHSEGMVYVGEWSMGTAMGKGTIF